MTQQQLTITPVFMSDPIYDELVEHLRKSYNNACVLYIDRITNPKLLQAFEARRNAFGAENANERRLYHGSNATAISAIIREGYKSAFNKRAVYGPGNYFSSAASYSKEYSDKVPTGENFMIVNRVLLGQSGDSGGDGNTIFVTKYDDAALPEYIICFHRDAE